ncbi:helix-hairpin-helix domain-containing protein [Thiomicrorhabdus arctica]|uniref:helix-hairpin-helix domain-containing protein n=1 Tax=Thiomicrorhabdus arctica TaxID=131540 RepID=UPI00035F2EAC|nr:helix-hairpin-helix domain-containing protein [Thiomicrorhabdus arctica]
MIRSEIKNFQDIPNIGKAMEKDFILIGLKEPMELANKDPYQMYQELCYVTQQKQDPCVLDVFISAVNYMQGGPPKKWWEFTQERKVMLAGKK